MGPAARETPIASRESSALGAAALVVLAGALAGAGALILAGVSGPPYLSTDGVNGWIVVFAAALFAALLAAPFALEGRLRASDAESDAGWERVVPLWGAIALGALAAGILAGVSGGFAGDSLAGSAGLVATIEAGLVVIALAFVLLSG